MPAPREMANANTSDNISSCICQDSQTMGIDPPYNFANLQTKVDQLLILQLSRERDIAEGHSMKALVSTLSGSCAQIAQYT